MAIDETKRFIFVSQGLPEDTFSVVEFKGTEGISRLYEFDITLASDDPEIDLKGVLQNSATLTTKGSDQDLPIHGILGQFEQLHEVKGHYFYRALLVPRLWQADLYHENQLFLDKKVPDIIEEILKQAGLTTQDYELKLTRSYPQWEYICQYRETDFDFISRWMEREGIYFFFQQGEDSEKLIITDSSTAHEDIRGDATIPFTPPSGIVPEKEAIFTFLCRQKRLPNKVILKDYNYRKPSLDLKAVAEVDARGLGDVYFYGEHFKTPQEGNGLAKIRAEEIKCRENIYHGESTAPNLCPGFFYELEDHYRQSYNQKYLIVEVEHEGHQTGSLWAGVEKKSAKGEKKLTYTNSFTAIRSDVQFRPERKTPKPKFPGTMNATIDAAGIGDYAELDDLGRYKVKLPFDQSDMEGGKASRWVRMQQPYAGAEHGMHFPLHKGTEVLLTFVDGDPDRPVIAGAVPNPETTSPVTAANQTESVIQTGARNKIRIEDFLGSERIIMETPAANSWIRLGTPNDPYYLRDRLPGKGIKIFTEGELIEESQDHQTITLEPVEDYNEAKNFELSDDAYKAIQQDLKKGNEHIQKNIDIINEYDASETQAKVKAEYERERNRLEDLKIDVSDPNPDADKRVTDDDYRNDQTKEIYKIIDYLKKICSKPISKTEFVSTFEKDNLDGFTIVGMESNWKSDDDNYDGKRDIIASAILRNTISNNAKQRDIKISGDQINATEGSHKITAINGERLFEMTDQGIFIDAGEDRDITIKCRKFFLKNEDEDNITYGDDFAEHYGTNEEHFYGKSDERFYGEKTEVFYGHKKDEHHGTTEEYFYGNKFCHTASSVEDFHWGHKLEVFGGSQEEISLIHSLALFAGFKEEFALASNFEVFAGLSTELFLGNKVDIGFGFLLEKKLIEIENKEHKIARGLMFVQSCGLSLFA
jgi:type VI secretion system VgrG family protein